MGHGPQCEGADAPVPESILPDEQIDPPDAVPVIPDGIELDIADRRPVRQNETGMDLLFQKRGDAVFLHHVFQGRRDGKIVGAVPFPDRGIAEPGFEPGIILPGIGHPPERQG